MQNTRGLALAAMAVVAAPVAAAATTISIEQTVAACRRAVVGTASDAMPVQSALKAETSRVGMAYLHYIYQNDSANPHFCEAMLHMREQAPAGDNPYVALFTPENAAATMAALADVQLSLDYAIARTDPPQAELEASLQRVRDIVD